MDSKLCETTWNWTSWSRLQEAKLWPAFQSQTNSKPIKSALFTLSQIISSGKDYPFQFAGQVTQMYEAEFVNKEI